jgi:hypothetical protein
MFAALFTTCFKCSLLHALLSVLAMSLRMHSHAFACLRRPLLHALLALYYMLQLVCSLRLFACVRMFAAPFTTCFTCSLLHALLSVLAASLRMRVRGALQSK